MIRSALAIALLCVALPVSAEVFKCTGPDGALTFSDKPCPGQATESVSVDVVEPTDAQRKQAGEIAERYRKMIEPKAGEASDQEGDAGPTRPRLRSGMSKSQVRAKWGAPDYISPYPPTNWGYHDQPPANVTFDVNDRVVSVFVDR